MGVVIVTFASIKNDNKTKHEHLPNLIWPTNAAKVVCTNEPRLRKPRGVGHDHASSSAHAALMS